MRFISIVSLFAFLSVSAVAQVRITEFMASNTRTLMDEDGDSSDWIEIQNTSSNIVSLLNWALTDSAGNPGKWRFPATNMPPKSFMVVFASGKNRTTPGAPLHTNFKLSADGKYLAMFNSDGSVATEITPQFPPQFPDVSYGIGMKLTTTALVATNAVVHLLIPSNAAVDSTWTITNFNDSNWQIGTNGIGYETGLFDPQEESFAAKMMVTQPVAYWRLNETNGPTALNLGSGGVSDGGGYLGAIGLGGSGPRPPQFSSFEPDNAAPTFDGTSASVNGPFELMNNLPAFTIAGWIYPTAAQNGRTGLFGQNDVVEFGFSDASTIQVWTPVGGVTTPYPFPNNQWHYLTAVGGNGQLALYFDGNLAASTPISAANFGESAFDFNIGGGGVFDPTGNYFKGQIDEVAVWFRALAANEIATLLSTNGEQVSYTNYIATDVRPQMYGSNCHRVRPHPVHAFQSDLAR